MRYQPTNTGAQRSLAGGAASPAPFFVPWRALDARSRPIEVRLNPVAPTAVCPVCSSTRRRWHSTLPRQTETSRIGRNRLRTDERMLHSAVASGGDPSRLACPRPGGRVRLRRQSGLYAAWQRMSCAWNVRTDLVMLLAAASRRSAVRHDMPAGTARILRGTPTWFRARKSINKRRNVCPKSNP